ncbi:MAG: efflux RND transporter periplasmic adaptor subunit [Vicinamibacteria bacterium]
MKSRGRLVILGVAVLLLGAAAYWFARSRQEPVKYVTAAADRGDVSEVVGATGTLQAVLTVQVGSQVSGTIQEMYVDFNTRVEKNQVIARLDPSLFEARLGQQKANLAAARANADRARTTLEDARLKNERAQQLSREQLLPQSDLETAQTNFASAAFTWEAADAATTQAAASVKLAEVDLNNTVIRAPISGVVISRSVDVGQTVAASLQAPTLFVIANDLSRMQVLASVDEADVGRIKTGQEVTFRVDSFPDRTFRGRVEQVRLQPTVAQNVVTYSAMISVDNPGQILMPGMTATVTVVSQARENVVRVPAAALRFRPEGFEAGAGGGQGRRGGQRAEATPGAGASTAAPAAAASPVALASPAAPAPAEEGRGRGRRREGASGAAADGPRPALVFVLGADGKPEPRRVRVGLSDGQFVEVAEGLEPGAAVIVGAQGPAGTSAPRPGASPSTNPFNPQFQRRQRG